MKSSVSRPHAAPLALLFVLCFLFWSRVLVTGNVLLPSEMLKGFAPFGSDSNAPWTILQWDALAQYFPWRHFASQSLHNGLIPLWNPYQFSGTPLVANAQSAVFYPLNLPFWIFDTAYAFGIAAFLHSILASFSTYFLAKHWKMSRAAAVLAAVAYTFCGYLTAWALLPTLFATASWLPICLFLFEKATDDEQPKLASFLLSLSVACALLAGHAQIFFYILLAMGLRQPFLHRKWRGMAILLGAVIGALALGALQLAPTLELNSIGHRAGGAPPTAADWDFWKVRALQMGDWLSLVVPGWTTAQGSLNENFGYVGIGALLLGGAGLLVAVKRKNEASKVSLAPYYFAISLAVFGFLYAIATPVSQFFFFGIPMVSRMGGTGRAFLLWSLGIALLAGFGLDFARRYVKSAALPLIALVVVGAELFGNAFITQPTAPRASIYPETELTTFLAKNTNPTARVLMLTPQRDWLPTEGFRGRSHPFGVLPPNGAMVYRIYDINGYDSLSLRQYRAWTDNEGTGVSPALNGNMVLINSLSPTLLDSLSVKYVVTLQGQTPTESPGTHVLAANGCDVWERKISGSLRVTGANFVRGWQGEVYAPTSFKFGGFLSLCMLGFMASAFSFKLNRRK